MGEHVNRFSVQGKEVDYKKLCHREILERLIRINRNLAKKPQECLEYIIVHEMAYLLEPIHTERFLSLMDKFMAKWQFYRDQLNRLPVSHEEWIC